MKLMKIVKKYTVAAALTVCMALNVSAQPTVKVNPEKGTITVSGRSKSENVKIIIIDSTAALEELDGGTASFAASGVYADSSAVKFENYKFENIEIDESKPFGDYSLRVTDGENYEDITFPYASKVQLADIISADSVENLMWLTDGFGETLKIDTEKYNKFDEDGKKEFLEDYMIQKGYTTENFGENFARNITIYLEKRTSDAINALTNAVTAEETENCINKYNDIYLLDFEAEDWLGSLKDEEITDIYARLASEKFSSVEEIHAKCKEKIALYYIEKGPWGSEEELLAKYESLLKLDLDDLNALSSSKKDTVYKKIKGTRAENGKKLQEIIDNAVKDAKNAAGTGGGSSVSSSGGSSSGSTGGFLAVGASADTVAKPSESIKPIFSDMNDAEWASDAISALYKKGIINGYNGKFMPNDGVTRAQLVKMIKEAFELNGTGGAKYDDVDENHWAYPYVSAASDIISGYGNGLFGADDYVTREDAAVFIYRALKIAGKNPPVSEILNFADAQDISDYAKEAVASLAANGIINGIDGNRFAPKATASRAEIAVILYRIL